MTDSFRRPSPGLLSLPILAIALIAPIGSLVDAAWVERSDVLYTIAIAAVIVGYVAARLPVPQVLAHLTAVLGGLAGVANMVARTLPPAAADSTQVAELYRRFLIWLDIVESGGYGNEPTLFLLLIAAGVYLNVYLATYLVFRKRSAFWAFATGGAILVVNVSWAIETITWLVPFGVASLVLAARLNLLGQESGWRERHVRYSPDVWGRTFGTGLFGALLIVGLGWYMPEIPPNPDFSQFTQSLADNLEPNTQLQTEFNRLFGGLRIRGVSPGGVSGFGNQLSLGGQFSLGDSPILRVTSPEPHYWRAVAYERYNGRGWLISPNARLAPFGATADLPMPETERALVEREEVTQKVEVLLKRGDRLVTSNRPLRVDIETSADTLAFGWGRIGGPATPTAAPAASPVASATAVPSPTVPPTPIPITPLSDVVALHGPIGRGTVYTVTSSITRAKPQMLRTAGASYPRDVVQRYTALPNSPAIPSRVRNLAAELTAGKDNAYDKAKSIESYLRKLEYSQQVTAPPSEVDAVDYFLFETKVGYCDYFSSAMTVMLRSVGVPARVASGYAVGERESEGVYVVRDSHAHSWVEVYFPRYGWVEFEPTPSRPLLDQLAESIDEEAAAAALLSNVGGDASDAGVPFWEQEYYRNPPFLGGALGEIYLGPDELPKTVGIVVIVLALLVVAATALWRGSFAGLAPPAAAYQRVTQLAALLGWRARPEETPREYGGRLGRAAPSGAGALGTIADAYTALRFGRRPSSLAEALALEGIWRTARDELLRARPRQLRARWESLRRGRPKPPTDRPSGGIWPN